MKLLLGCTFSAAALLIASGVGQAAPPQLKGQYGFTGSAHCIVSASPFDSNFQATGFTTVNSFSVEGVRTFKGDGTGTIKGRSVSITPPPVGSPPVTPISGSSGDFSAQFTYVVDGSGGFTTEIVPGTFLGQNVAGPGAGATWTLDRLSLHGLISQDKQTLTLASVAPVMETQTFLTGPIAGQTRYRICHRSRVLIWMGN